MTQTPYDPRALVNLLYERLVSREDAEEPRALVEKYIGVIEEKEKIPLAEIKEKTIRLGEALRGALALYEEDGDAYSETDIEKLSTALDAAYFDPLSELLEGVLVVIAGN
ncbi:MAG: hypothetical protein LBC67_02695 [Spirochaetales bacterium]|nr:hypothetical protein [Spirochaetales bacterium]